MFRIMQIARFPRFVLGQHEHAPFSSVQLYQFLNKGECLQRSYLLVGLGKKQPMILYLLF